MAKKLNKRRYTKRNSEYWTQKSLGMSNTKSEIVENIDLSPKTYGSPLISFEESNASRLTEPTSRSKSRTNRITKESASSRFENIDKGILPFKYSEDKVSVYDSIILTQKAYFNVAVFKSTIDLLSEFANTEIYLKGGDESSRKFINAWFDTINLSDLKEQVFREYFRSGNVFLYELTGKLTKNSVRSFSISDATKKINIPVKYVVLNPSDIIVKEQLTFGQFTYAKALTPFEIARLKESKTKDAKKLFNSLPDEIKRQLQEDKISSTSKEIHLPLDADILHPIFYKKQDYEPLSIPMGFCVLDDINKKLELKKVDQAIARSIENVVLLITMGSEPDKGGVNHNNLRAMQEIFENQSIGRVLVSDYTTKADFVIPDLRKVIGKEKYEVLNKDIEEGLSNILLGESKYSNAELQMRIFFERLQESRNRFLKDFLQKEIVKVCKEAGFRKPPKAAFVKKDTVTSEDLQKLTTRMMELGLITPEQGMDVINKGSFPDSSEMKSAQAEYLKDRERGYYLPMVSAQSLFETENEDVEPELRKESPNTDPNTNPRGRNQKNTVSSPTGGRPVGTASTKFSVKSIKEVVEMISSFEKKAQLIYKEKLGLNRLTKPKKEVIFDLCSSLACSYEIEEWEQKLIEIIDDNSVLASMSVSDNVLSIAAEHSLDDYSAAILYHSTKLQNANS